MLLFSKAVDCELLGCIRKDRIARVERLARANVGVGRGALYKTLTVS
jgi:hypothetical protein